MAPSTCTFTNARDEQLSARLDQPDGRVQRFTRTVTLRGDLDDQARSRLLTIAGQCPVHRTLEGQIEIHTQAGEA